MRPPQTARRELTEMEKDELVANCDRLATLKHSSSLPYAFTEHGVVMLAAVLNSKRAVEVSLFVVKAFVRMRRIMADQRQLALKLAELETKFASHDRNFKVVFDTLRQLMQPPPPKRTIGFATDPDDNILARERPARRPRKP